MSKANLKNINFGLVSKYPINFFFLRKNKFNLFFKLKKSSVFFKNKKKNIFSNKIDYTWFFFFKKKKKLTRAKTIQFAPLIFFNNKQNEFFLKKKIKI